MDTAEFDRFADEYDQLHEENIAVTGEKPEFFHEYKIKVLAQLAQDRSIRPDSILDFGSGIGNSTPFLHHYFTTASLTGTEVSQRSLDVAESRFPNISTGLLIDGQRIPAEDNSFDITFSACVFHHIPHEEHLHWLKELRRVTRRGGMLAIFEHNPLNPLTRLAVHRCPFDADAVLLRSGKTEALLRGTGARNIETRFFLLLPSKAPLARRFETLAGRLPLGAQYLTCAQA